MDDAGLVRQVLGGRTEAYGELVARWAGRITALCHARVGRAVSADLAQETLLRGLQELASLIEPQRFGPWLSGIAINVCRDWLKSRQNSQAPFSALGPPAPNRAWAASSPGANLEQQDEVRRLMTEVEALPEECRTVLMLYYYQDLTYRELADVLDVSSATANARLTRARALLRARLGALPGPSGARPREGPPVPFVAPRAPQLPGPGTS